MTVRVQRPALIIVDMQNDFVRVGAPMEVPTAREIIPAIQNVLEAFRNADLPVVFTRYIASPHYRNLRGKLSWLNLIEAPTYACVADYTRLYGDVDGAKSVVDVVDELKPLKHELISDKFYFSAFHETDLNARLQASGVDEIYITGTLTEMCVDDTARHGVHFGYPVTLIADCLASNDLVDHSNCLEAFQKNYGSVQNSIEVIALIQS